MGIKIGDIDTIPYHDPYHRGQCVPTAIAMYIDPEHKYVTVGTVLDQGAIDAEIWHHRVIESFLSTHDDYGFSTPDAKPLREFLESETAQELLRQIADNYTVDWDGHNHVGSHTDESGVALEQLLAAIADLPHSTWQLCNAGDWLFECRDSYITDSIGRAVSNRVLEARARELETELSNDNVILDGDVLDQLREWRDELREERAS
jgi:hypothetical protein